MTQAKLHDLQTVIRSQVTIAAGPGVIASAAIAKIVQAVQEASQTSPIDKLGSPDPNIAEIRAALEAIRAINKGRTV